MKDAPRGARASSGERLAIALLVACFLLLAGRTIARYEYYPSEQNVLGPAERWLGRTERYEQKYPPFSAYFYYPVLWLHHGVGWIEKAVPAHLVARSATVLLSSASLVLLWRAGRSAAGASTGVLAAFFLATNHSFFALSQLTHPEALLAFLVVCQIHQAVGILRTGRTVHYVASAAIVAAALATKYFAPAMVLPIAAHLFRARPPGGVERRGPVRGVLDPRLWLLCFLVPAGILLLVPDLKDFVRGIYPTIRNDGYFTNAGPCCLRLPQTGLHRAFLWPALVLLPYCAGAWGYGTALAGMALRPRGQGSLETGFWRVLVVYVLVAFSALQLMTSYLAPQSFTFLHPALALFSARAAGRAIAWARRVFPWRRGTAAALVASVAMLAPVLPGLASISAFYEVVSTNGNHARALLAFLAADVAKRRPPVLDWGGAFGGGFDMVATSEALAEMAAREPLVIFLMDCFVENVRKRAVADPHCARLRLDLRSFRAGDRYVPVATIPAPPWWGRRLYERIDPELSLDMRFYVHRSVFDERDVEALLDGFERRHPGGRGVVR